MKKILFAFLVFLAVPLLGQSLSEEIIVTASAAPETVESTPAAVTVISREEIEAREARDVVDVLREVPGLTVSRTGSQGKVSAIFIRGGSSKQALVLWNGVEVNNAYFSAYNFGQLSSAGVQRVEIVRGPYSALYGADAVSGVINILTTPGSSGFTADVEAGENGLLSGAISGAYTGSAITAHGSIDSRRDDGFDDNDDYTGDSAQGGVLFRAGDSFSLGVNARLSRYDLGIPRNVNGDSTAFVPTPRRREDGSESQVVLPIQFRTGRYRFDVRVAEHRRHDEFEDPDAPFGAEFANTDAVTRSARTALQLDSGAFGVMTAGLELEHAEAEHTDSFGLDVASQDRDSRSAFFEDRLSFRRNGGQSFELALGARYDDFDSFGSEVSPRIGVAYLAGRTKWRAAYGEGFRAPAIGELYVPFFGNPSLGAERSRNLEAGFDLFLSSSSMFSATVFDSDYADLIAYDGSTNRFENIESASSRGLELGFSGQSGPFSTSLSYMYLDAEDELTGDHLLRRPDHSGSVSLGYDRGPVGATFVVIHAGERPDITDLLPFGRVVNEPYTTADLTVRYSMGALSPYVKVENLTDEAYEEVFGYPSARRRAIVGVRYTME
jgi:vitamin B12 transporter